MEGGRRKKWRKRTSDKGTPPAVTNSSLNWPFDRTEEMLNKEFMNKIK